MSRLSHGILVAVLAVVPAAGGTAEPVTPDLTPKLDRLLRQEMAAVEEAMQAIFAAMVRGDHGAVAEKAQQVHDSFMAHPVNAYLAS